MELTTAAIAVLLCLSTTSPVWSGDISLRWNSTYQEVYYSRADGAGVPFEVRLPPAIEGLETYPVLVVLGGGPRVDPSPEYPFIQVKPSRGGIWGYRAISAYDAMEVIAFLKRHYPVDPDRIYLTGFSAGASGAMHLASCYPSTFAAVLPLVAVGTGYPLGNFRNLPVAIHHGTDDWTSSVCNARVQVERLRESGSPALLEEYPGIGHAVPEPHEPLMDWLLEQTRDRSKTGCWNRPEIDHPSPLHISARPRLLGAPTGFTSVSSRIRISAPLWRLQSISPMTA